MGKSHRPSIGQASKEDTHALEEQKFQKAETKKKEMTLMPHGMQSMVQAMEHARPSPH